jgi:hypothetical protein
MHGIRGGQRLSPPMFAKAQTQHFPIAKLVRPFSDRHLVLPKEPIAVGLLLGKPLSAVPKSWGVPWISGNERDYDRPGARVRLVLSEKRIVEVRVMIDSFAEGRDNVALFHWLKVEGGKVGSVAVETKAFSGGVLVRLDNK